MGGNVAVKRVSVREIACARAGDKGDVSNVVVVPYEAAGYEFLREELTVERVREHFGELVVGDIVRYELPGIQTLNFVMTGALAGGVTRSIWLDAHGKSRASLMLTLELDGWPA
ncbi:MAG: hypothetical protein JWO37_1765 [Acidimicrobiales bacterium]|jgi:hypothetical protein|nr:hypothetical protein [Acidimicrobiales bacterium]